MSFFKKIIFTALVAACVLPSVPVAAVNLGGGLLEDARSGAGYAKPENPETALAETIGFIINIALSFVGVIFTTLMVYAGYLWMTAAGESDQIDKAKKIITASIIGLIITLGSWSISNFVVSKVVTRVSAPATVNP